LHQRNSRRNFEKGLFNWKLEWFLLFLIVGILFTMVDFHINKMFFRRTLPHNPRVMGYKNDVGTMYHLLLFSVGAGHFVSKKLS
jgi:hypothetical protein